MKCESSLNRLHSSGLVLLLTKFIGYADNDDRMMENGNFSKFLLFLQLIAYENKYNNLPLFYWNIQHLVRHDIKIHPNEIMLAYIGFSHTL